eukprot:comp7481_c1_seq1/m.3144 comp7481_c1_seq1/g.3144  ORF comp7481_c1_seq1/g.3144 comp7481_c1_seq1/m.3144 type:complete len:411 (-) comp7481_c1_seq1:689-1921(-)
MLRHSLQARFATKELCCHVQHRRLLYATTKDFLQRKIEESYDVVTNLQAAFGKRHKVMTWSDAVVNAKKVVHAPSSLLNVKAMLSWRLSTATLAFKHVRRLVKSGHPLVNTMKDCLLEKNGHNIRPLIVLLMAKAVSGNVPPGNFSDKQIYYEDGILKSQKALAEITEMIHVASLIHEDVVDVSNLAPDVPKPPEHAFYGNKLSVLTGDFLLAKSSVALAQLQNVDVVAHMSAAIADFIEGQSTLYNPVNMGMGSAVERVEREMYLRTASLVARSCAAVCLLGGVSKGIEEKAYAFGKHMGIAYQLILDLQSFQEAVSARARAGRQLSFIAPVVFAAHSHASELAPLLKGPHTDVDKVHELVAKSAGIEQTQSLIHTHCALAMEALSQLPQSDARNALLNMAVTLKRGYL